MIVVRYADDTIVGFQHRQDAERFLIDLKERLAKFALSLHPEKTRLLEFGRYRCRTPGRAGPGQAGDVRFPGVHALLQHQEGRHRLPTRAQDAAKANESQAPGDQGDTTTAQAYADRRAGTVARDHDERLFRLLRGADQHIPAVGLPLSHQHHLVPQSAATQPAAPADLGTDDPTHQAVPTVIARAAPVAKASVPRQRLEVGAECVSSARSDLCGGRSAMAIPTAIKSVSGAETVQMAEGNMSGRDMRAPCHPVRSEALARANPHAREPGGPTFDRRKNVTPWSASGRRGPKPTMHEHEKSDPAVGAVKPANKAGEPAAELVEPRAGPKGNADSAKHAPGAGPGKCVAGAGTHTASSPSSTRGKSRMHKGARPVLYGGRGVTRVPTATQNAITVGPSIAEGGPLVSLRRTCNLIAPASGRRARGERPRLVPKAG